jgi:hypothetical protein
MGAEIRHGTMRVLLLIIPIFPHRTSHDSVWHENCAPKFSWQATAPALWYGLAQLPAELRHSTWSTDKDTEVHRGSGPQARDRPVIAGLDAASATRAQAGPQRMFRSLVPAFRVVAPGAPQRAAFQEDRGANPRPVVNGVPLDVKDHARPIVSPGRCLPGKNHWLRSQSGDFAHGRGFPIAAIGTRGTSQSATNRRTLMFSVLSLAACELCTGHFGPLCPCSWGLSSRSGSRGPRKRGRRPGTLLETAPRQPREDRGGCDRHVARLHRGRYGLIDVRNLLNA